MIGHLQKNKAARAAQLFDTIDSVDSAALAEKLDRARADSIKEDTENTAPGKTRRESERHLAQSRPVSCAY